MIPNTTYVSNQCRDDKNVVQPKCYLPVVSRPKAQCDSNNGKSREHGCGCDRLTTGIPGERRSRRMANRSCHDGPSNTRALIEAWYCICLPKSKEPNAENNRARTRLVQESCSINETVSWAGEKPVESGPWSFPLTWRVFQCLRDVIFARDVHFRVSSVALMQLSK